MHKCRNCLIPDTVPGVTIAQNGVCNLCQQHASTTDDGSETKRKTFEEDLETTLTRTRGAGEYDCLVPVSGGKDSVALLYRLRSNYKLRILAFTTDVNIPPLAWDNIRRTLEKLEIDHVVYRPPDAFYRKLFRYLLRNQEERGAVYTVSYVYAPLFEGDAIKLAVEKQIPLVLAGYSPGQPEPERMLYEFSRPLIEGTDWTPPELRRSGQFSEAELGRFFNPANFPEGTQFPRYLAPFHAWNYDQEAIMKEVVESGLVRSSRHASPVFSNYPINWLLMYSDLKHFGYNPYVPEFSALIRAGKANRTHWKILGPLVDMMIRRKVGLGAEVKRSLKWLELSEKDLQITKPRGSYDPPLA